MHPTRRLCTAQRFSALQGRHIKCHHSTPRSHPALRRVSRVYVEIPPSPYSRVRETVKSHVSLTLKENAAPPQLITMKRDVGENITNDVPSPQKRRMQAALSVANSHKKPRISSSDGSDLKSTLFGKQTVLKPFAQKSENKQVFDKFRSGHVVCHHCRVKREPADCLQCTVKIGADVDGKERRCRASYCKSCLKKRYGEDLASVLANGQRPSSQSLAHVQDVSYAFQCPRCRKVCNCYRCRKPPTLKPKKKSEALPPPIWRKVDASLSLANVESRIQVREFVMRFREIMKGVTENYLEELEELAGNRWATEGDADEAEAEWVSDGCVKAVVIGLLQVITQDETGEIAKILQTAIKDLRRFTSKLDRVWGTLAALRDSLSADPDVATAALSRAIPLTFPDPYPPLTSSTSRVTRSGSTQAVLVAHSGQMLPVLVALTDLAGQTKGIRESLEAAAKEAKELISEEREAQKRENDRFDSDKQALLSLPATLTCTEAERAAKVKARQIARVQVLRNLDCALKIMLCDHMLRAGPLGRDLDGRVYWAMSPGLVGRETANRALVLEGGQESEGCRSKKSGKGKKKRRRTAADRQSMTAWSWFVAVWGKKPGAEPNAMAPQQPDLRTDGIDSEADGEEDGEQWWGFCEPDEIKRLAAWINHRDEAQREDTALSGEEERQTAPPTKDQVRDLVRALQDRAEVLHWMIEREEEVDIDEVLAVSSGRRKGERVEAVPTTNFYA